MKEKTLIIGINSVDFGSTGNIMRNTLEYSTHKGDFDYLIITKNNIDKENVFGYMDNSSINHTRRALCCRLTKFLHKKDGFALKFLTKQIVKKIEQKRLEYNGRIIVHMHNVHSSLINIKVLFNYFAQKNITLFYTLHDEWSYTGGCYCYEHVKCDKWQSGCTNCEYYKDFNANKFSPARVLKIKQKLFNKVKSNLTIVTVSNWLKNEVKKSILKDFDIKVNYGETSIEPLECADSDLKKKLNISNDKKVLISVSAYWNEWKGKKYLYEIAKIIPQDYVLLIVGGTFETKGYDNIIHINNVSQKELAHYYSIADCFVSTTQTESLSLVLCEAQMCGVPIVGFGHGGTPETITNKSGIMVGTDNDIDKLRNAVIFVVENKPFNKSDIIASGNRFKKYEHAKRQLELYKQIVNDNF